MFLSGWSDVLELPKRNSRFIACDYLSYIQVLMWQTAVFQKLTVSVSCMVFVWFWCAGLSTRHASLQSANKNDLLILQTALKFGDWAFSVAAPVAWNSLRRRSALSVAQQLLRTNLKRFSFTTFYNISVQYAFNSSLYFILIEIFIASELVSCVGKLFCQNWLIDWLI